MENCQWQKLGDLIDLKTSKQTLVKKQYVENGQYNVITSASKPAGKYDQFNEAGKQITISKDGTCGVILWHEQPFYLADGAFVIKIKPGVDLDLRYLYHYLKRSQAEINEMQIGQPIAHLYKADLNQLKVYVPDLETQKQIAATLDKFNQLTNQLTNQLNLRNKQYQYYLEHLMDFANVNHPLIKDGGGGN